MISRKIAYQTWAAVLERQARRLRSLASDAASRRAHRRAGAEGRGAAAEKAGLRLEQAARLERDAAVLAAWAAGNGPPGGDVEDAIVGLIAAYLHHDTRACASLLAHCGARRRVADGPSPAETIEFIKWILEC